MDRKILYIGLTTLFLVLLSTIALIVLVVKPSFFPISSETKIDSLTIQGELPDSLLRKGSIYDSLNYSISTMTLKRENILLSDSIRGLWGNINNEKRISDSLRAEIRKQSDTLSLKERRIVDLTRLNASFNETESKTFSDKEKKGYAKIYENMSPEVAAKHMELMTDNEAINILLNIDNKQGAKILDKLESRRAAKIWNALNTRGTK
jgi:flagellar motility protein MotE (MotC chaperone)